MDVPAAVVVTVRAALCLLLLLFPTGRKKLMEVVAPTCSIVAQHCAAPCLCCACCAVLRCAGRSLWRWRPCLWTMLWSRLRM